MRPRRCDAPITPPREREGKEPRTEREATAMNVQLRSSGAQGLPRAPEGLLAGTEAGGQSRSREPGARNAPALTARLRPGSSQTRARCRLLREIIDLVENS